MNHNDELPAWFRQMYTSGDTFNPTGINDARRRHTLIPSDEALDSWPRPSEGEVESPIVV